MLRQALCSKGWRYLVSCDQRCALSVQRATGFTFPVDTVQEKPPPRPEDEMENEGVQIARLSSSDDPPPIDVDPAVLRDKYGPPPPQAAQTPSNGAAQQGRIRSVLSEHERRVLADMVYDAHYASVSDAGRRSTSDGPQGDRDRTRRFQAKLEVHFIEESVLDESTRGFSTSCAATIDDELRRRVKRLVLERCDLRKPLSYIIGHQPFFGCRIACQAPILCPRPETELWVHWLVSTYLSPSAGKRSEPLRPTEETPASLRVVDMCCGTGCVGVAVAKHVPHARVLALDVDPQAVALSRTSAKQNGLSEAAYAAAESDMFQGLRSEPRHSVDCLLCNPPYILPQEFEGLPAEVRTWESRVALVGDAKREGKQYMYFKELCDEGAEWVKPASRRPPCVPLATPSMVIEVGLQGPVVAGLMEQHPAWTDVELHTDLSGKPRWISARRRD